MRQRCAPLPPGTPVSSPTARRRTAWSSRGSAMRLPTSKVSDRRCAAELSSSTPDCQASISVPVCTPSARCAVPLHARRYSTVTTAPSATPPAIFSRFQEAPSVQEGRRRAGREDAPMTDHPPEGRLAEKKGLIEVAAAAAVRRSRVVTAGRLNELTCAPSNAQYRILLEDSCRCFPLTTHRKGPTLSVCSLTSSVLSRMYKPAAGRII